MLAVDHHRDVALGRALRNRAHVDGRRAPSAPKTLAATPCDARHAVAHHARGCCGIAASTWTLLNLAFAQLRVERPRARHWPRARRPASGIAQQIECSELPCEIRMTEMPCSRSAPNRRCAVPGTPIMPAPSRLTSATCVDAGDALHRRAASAAWRRSACRASRARTCCGSRSGCLFVTAGAMVCGWITLAPKYASSIASLYDSESMTLRVGHQARVGAQHAVHVGPDVDLFALRAARRRSTPEKSLPLRPSVVCTPLAFGAMKPVMMSVSVSSRATAPPRRWRDPPTARPGRAGPHCTSTMSRASTQRTVLRRPRDCEGCARTDVRTTVRQYPRTPTSRVSLLEDARLGGLAQPPLDVRRSRRRTQR